MRMMIVSLVLVLTSVAAAESPAGSSLWRDVAAASLPAGGERLIVPQTERVLRLDIAALKDLLDRAPLERIGAPPADGVVVDLPLPGGGTLRLGLLESPVMEAELAVRYPGIRTFAAREVGGGSASGRCDITPAGFHAMIFTGEGTVFIDPFRRGDAEHYSAYWRQDGPAPQTDAWGVQCPVPDPAMEEEIARLVRAGVPLIGEQLRTYRLAVATTGEYTTFHGGTVALGLAAVVTAVNRVVGVYEKEAAVRMVLVANNDLLIYTNSSTDPYTNNDGLTMLGQNQTTVDGVIGTANYDIGHVFSTGGGGIAGLGVVCRSGNKARGVTGLPSPTGDPFYIDYVAHEMGHQYGANHTFNGTAGSCGGGNRSAANAYEPGSGSTIMAYAGICGSHNIQSASDAYFHSRSIDEIVAYTVSGLGNGCPVVSATGNTAPVVTVPAGGFVIPRSTPFALEGSAVDGEGDAMTYCWEEFDLGPGGAPNSPTLTAPIFRSFLPATTPLRFFPRLTNILNNNQTIGEILPAYGRALTFRLTVRDNRAAGGGVGKATMAFTVADSAGPFVVTSPNTTTARVGGSLLPVTWSVAQTNIPPVSCDSVMIRLSTDGGQTFPTVLSSGTPNDGEDTVMLPAGPFASARVKVEALGNVFFDLSNASFAITALAVPALVSPLQDAVESPDSLLLVWRSVTGAAHYRVQVGTDSAMTGGLVLDDSLLADTTAALSGLDSARSYYWRTRAVNAGGPGAWSAVRRFTTLGSLPAGPALVQPEDGTVVHADSVELGWGQTGPLVLQYAVEWTTDSAFASFAADTLGTDTSYVLRALADSTQYYWRVRARNALGWGDAGGARQFRTIFFVNSCLVIHPSWNLLSLPVAAPVDSLSAFFPGCGAGCAFQYQPGAGYQQVCSIEAGVGYWVKCTADTICLSGVEILRDSIPVTPGWNLFPALSVPVADTSLTSDPPGIIVSPLFGFTASGYSRVTTLLPGGAYWVRVDQPGVIVLDGGPAVRARSGSEQARND